jgi:hypothetical protein
MKVDNQYVIDPKLIANVFDNHFKSIFNTNYPSVTPSDQIVSVFYPLLLSLLLK